MEIPFLSHVSKDATELGEKSHIVNTKIKLYKQLL